MTMSQFSLTSQFNNYKFSGYVLKVTAGIQSLREKQRKNNSKMRGNNREKETETVNNSSQSAFLAQILLFIFYL